MTSITQTPAWLSLAEERCAWDKRHLKDLFAEDSNRFGRFSISGNGLLLDYSKNLINEEVLEKLVSLAEQAGVPEWREKLFSGAAVNNTEERAAMHTALRSQEYVSPDITNAVQKEFTRVKQFVGDVRDGKLTGTSGKPFTDVILIGIGGSHLGPELGCEALAGMYPAKLRAHFVSNTDPDALSGLLGALPADTSLVIIASKSFTTIETMANAGVVLDWLIENTGSDEAIARQTVGISSNQAMMREFGIVAEHQFAMWDWVGGRYSIWSTIGLPVALMFGFDVFTEFLSGGADMDAHFYSAPLNRNMPVILGLLSIWYGNFFGAQTHAVLPYRAALRKLPDYLQQLEMESNGKSVTRDGEPVDYTTAPVIWGGMGQNGQHAFFQLLHQGTRFIPADFILSLDRREELNEPLQILAANCIAQTEALMLGRQRHAADDSALAAHKTFQGNRPSNTILLEKLDAASLGRLIALYEHKVFVESCIWKLNAFDQMGVELGKQLAKQVWRELQEDATSNKHDCSTAELIDIVKQKIGV